MNKHKIEFAIFLCITILCISAMFWFSNESKQKMNKQSQQDLQIKQEKLKKIVSSYTETASTTSIGSHYRKIESADIEAKSALVQELNSGYVLFSKNVDEALPLASITKIMTALAVTKNFKEDDVIEILPNDLLQSGDSGLIAEEKWEMKDLRDFTLVTSSNDGAFALSRQTGNLLKEKDTEIREIGGLDYFTAQMNTLAEDLGMQNSLFSNGTGLDIKDETEPGAVASANDVGKLVSYVMKNYPQILPATAKPAEKITSSSGFIHNIENTNQITGSLPNILASKTGYTTLAGGNLVVVLDPGLGNPVIITVLGSSEEGRFKDVKKLADQLVGSQE